MSLNKFEKQINYLMLMWTDTLEEAKKEAGRYLAQNTQRKLSKFAPTKELACKKAY